MDAATGLLYVGNGQYYDPATGRFLTRDAKPDNTNPYVPWNPIGAIVGPLGLIALVFGRRKKGSKVGTFLVLLLVVGSVGMTLSACGGGSGGTTPPPAIPPTDSNGTSSTATTTTAQTSTAPAPTETPAYTCMPVPTGNKPTLIIFGGSGGDASAEGPEVPGYHMTAWKSQYLSDYKVFYQRYQSGGKAAAARYAASRDDLQQEINVALICYSGGTEACLMYADLRHQQGLSTESIVLLGGGFYTHNLNGDLVGFEYWGGQINQRLGESTRILVVNDNQNDSSSADSNSGFTPINNLYVYHTVGIDHYAVPQSDGTYWRPTDDLTDQIVDKSPTLRDAILQWVKTGCWTLPEYWSPT